MCLCGLSAFEQNGVGQKADRFGCLLADEAYHVWIVHRGGRVIAFDRFGDETASVEEIALMYRSIELWEAGAEQ